ncbi:MAG: hypothetical protein AMXMBFR58_34550 [Phycisphaerae bacterium]|nr:hydrogenase maturation nickel metallochaperone HypA [Phycisphaerales bacterium]
MHELPMTQHILDIALEHAIRSGSSRLTDVHLVVGDLAGASFEAIEFYWQFLTRDTPAQGSVLHMRRVPLELSCPDCDARFRPAELTYSCPTCGGTGTRAVAGDEFFIEAIEVDEADPASTSPPEHRT